MQQHTLQGVLVTCWRFGVGLSLELHFVRLLFQSLSHRNLRGKQLNRRLERRCCEGFVVGQLLL